MNEIITYEEVYELLRAEKNSTDLEELDTETINRINLYINSKRALLNQQNLSMFSGVKERVKILTEIENVRNVILDIFERRERKIINRAIHTVRTDLKVKDTTNMLPSEAELYLAVLELLEKKNNEVLKVIDGESAPKPKEIEKVIEFTEDIPEMVGSDSKHYGPFMAGQKSSMPSDLMDLLTSLGKAKFVEIEKPGSEKL